MLNSRVARRILKTVKVMAMPGFLGIAALLVSLWFERGSDITLPSPTGPFAVGRAIYDWTDDATSDKLAPLPGTKRELLVWIWYPTAVGQSIPADDYLPAGMRGPGTPHGLFKLLTRDLSKVHSHSMGNAEVSSQQQSYPVVLLRAGASSQVWNYSTLAEDLASHGYVVVGFDAPYRTLSVVFPDGRVMRRTAENNPELCEELPQAQQADCVDRELTAWTSDSAFVLDRLEQLNNSDVSGKFTKRLDMTRVGMFGHSLGGATTAQFCHDDLRCKAGIDVDGQPFGSVTREGLHIPFMFLLSDQAGSSDPVEQQFKTSVQSIYDRLPSDGRLRVAIRGGYHFGFSDDGALLKSHILMRMLRALGVVGIDGRRQLAVTKYCVHSFFDAYLRGTSSLRPKISSADFSEIQLID